MAHGQWILARFPVGKKVPVHYSPKAPQLAVLETGIHGGTWTQLSGGTLFVLAGWMLLQVRTANPGGRASVKLHQPPILMSAIFVLMGASVCLMVLSRGTSD